MIENNLRNSDGSYKASSLELSKKLASVIDEMLEQYGEQLSYDNVATIAHSTISERLALKVALESDEIDSWKKEYELLPKSMLPKLLLGIRIKDGSQKYVFNQMYNDYKFAHRTTNNNKMYFHGIVLTPYPQISAWIEETVTTFDPEPEDMKRMEVIRDYQDNALSKFSLRCDYCYPLLSKGLMPMDVNNKTLKVLSSEYDRLPKDLDDMINWSKSSNVNRMSSMNRWGLFILY